MTRDERERFEKFVRENPKTAREIGADAVLAALRAPAVTGEADIVTAFVDRCEEIRNGSPNQFYAHVDKFCKTWRGAAPPVTEAPPDLVALVQRAQKAFKASQSSTTGCTLGDWTDALGDLLAWSPAPAPVAPPADEHVVGYTPDGTPLMRVVNINAAGNTDVGVYAMPTLKREPAPVTPPAPVSPTSVSDDGDDGICFDFDYANGRVVSLTIYSDGTIGWSAVVGDQEGCGRGPLPEWVRAAILAGPPAPAPVAPPAETFEPPMGVCQWIDDTGDYTTECGHVWQFIDGDVALNDAKFCPFCGGKIQVVDDHPPAPPTVTGTAMPEIQIGDGVTIEDDLGQRYEHRVETQADAKVPDGYRAVRIRRVIWRRQEGQ